MSATKSFVLFVVIFLACMPAAHSQSNYSSPYSRFGLGDLYQPVNATNGAMGGLKYGIRSPFLVNPSNPASYTAFNLNNVVFDAVLAGSMVRMDAGDKTRDDGHFNLGSLTFGIPLNKKLAAAMGFLPYSTVGYAISDPAVHPDFGGYNTIFEGTGGLSRVFGGLAWQITNELSAGVNLNYFFGSLNYLQTVTFDSIHFINVRAERSRIFSDFTWDAGLQYRHVVNKEKEISLVAGLSGGIASPLSLREDLLVETFRYTSTGVIIAKDTVTWVEGEKGKVQIPLHLAGGLSLQRGDRWMLGADLSFQDWSSYEAFGINDSLQQSYQIALGGQYKYNSIYLRGGIRFHQTYLNIRDNQLNEYGISFGVGIPVYNKAYSVSMLSAGVELGQRGTTEQGLIRERFGRLWLSFTMNQERWFKRREYL